MLARRDSAAHLAALERAGIGTIDLVVVNLYPFQATVADPACRLEDAIENIDIGGPAMLRSAAKNHAAVAVVTDPADYASLLDEIGARGEVSAATRFRLAAKAFAPHRRLRRRDRELSTRRSMRRARGVNIRQCSACSSTASRSCATAKTRTRLRRSTATRIRSRVRSRQLYASSRARSSPTTTSPMPTPHGSASRRSTRRPA